MAAVRRALLALALAALAAAVQPARAAEQQQKQQAEEAVSAEELLKAAADSLASASAEDLNALHIKLLADAVEQLPSKIENTLSAHLAEILIKQIRSWVIDPTQAAVLNATATGEFNPMGSRMVHFHNKDLLVLAPKNDEFVGGHILRTGTPFMAGLLDTMLDLISLRPGSTVIDAGANIGSYSIFFAAVTGPKGRVFSFEPQRKMFQILCANAIVNGLLNVYPQNMALSFGPGEVHMSAHVPDGTAQGEDIKAAEEKGESINYGGMGLGVGGEAVQAMTLDSFNLTGVSLIKVDVQGAEQLMFYGSRDTIRRNLPVVVYERQAGFMAPTREMNETMKIPDAVHRFNLTTYLVGLGYQASPYQPSGDDIIWLPPNHEVLQMAAMLSGKLVNDGGLSDLLGGGKSKPK